MKDLKQFQKDNARKELSDLVRENRKLSRKLETAEASPKAGVGSIETTGSYGGASLSVSTSQEGYEQVSLRSDRGRWVCSVSGIAVVVILFPDW